MGELSGEEAGTLDRLSRRLAPERGLPGPVFEFAYAIVPMVNIDLVALDGRRFLLAWREDQFAKGWHVPGGIFRRSETFAHRIMSTAADEVGATVEAANAPAAILEIFRERGHSISFLFPCRSASAPTKTILDRPHGTRSGSLCWFEAMPGDAYPGHKVYEETILEVIAGRSNTPPAMLSVRPGEGA